MKAVLLKNTDKDKLSDNLVIEDIPKPEINDDEILIKVVSASVNHRDVYISEGAYSKINLPVVLGSDCSGIVGSVGTGVKKFKPGDEVIINPGMNWGVNENFQSREFKILGMPDNGTFAEFVKINQVYVWPKPSHLNFTQASAFPLAGITAYRALFKKAKLKKSENILITGIGGGVATLAMMFAISTGAHVFVTSGSDAKIKIAVSIGAKAGVNYNDNDWDKKINLHAGNKIDVIIDGTGSSNISKAVELCSYGGRIVSYGATLGSADNFSLHRVYWKQLKLYGSTMGSQKDFSEMLEFINAHKVVPVIDKVFSLENICDAFKRMGHSEQFGKIIIETHEKRIDLSSNQTA